MFGCTSVTHVASFVDHTSVSGVLGGSVLPLICIFSSVTPDSGVTERLSMLMGVVKAADFKPVNGSAYADEISFGAIKLTGFDVSAA